MNVIFYSKLIVLYFTYRTAFSNNDTNVYVIQKGVSGETVDGMLHRLPIVLSKNTNIKYDIAIILGGTNDLYTRGNDPDHLAADILKLHKIAKKHGIPHTFVVTIPENKMVIRESLNSQQRRNFGLYAINEILRKYVADKWIRYGHGSSVRLIDLERYMPWVDEYTNGVETSDDNLWLSDGLHMSKTGYDNFGKLIFKNIMNLLGLGLVYGPMTSKGTIPIY